MRIESFQQFAIVKADSAELLTDRLNTKLYELRDKRPTVTFEGMIARISYTEDTRVKEDLCDEYEEIGVRLKCGQCPLFRPQLNRDGSVDRRAKWGGCDFSPLGYGQTNRESSACNRLFEMLNSGEVRLCLESE